MSDINPNDIENVSIARVSPSSNVSENGQSSDYNSQSDDSNGSDVNNESKSSDSSGSNERKKYGASKNHDKSHESLNDSSSKSDEKKSGDEKDSDKDDTDDTKSNDKSGAESALQEDDSASKDEASDKKKKEEEKKKKEKRKAIKEAAVAAKKLWSIQKLYQLFRLMLLMLMQALQAIAALIVGAIQALIHLITTVAAAIATALAISVIAATVGVVGLLVLAVVVVVAVAVSYHSSSVAQRDEVVVEDPCVVGKKTLTSIEGDVSIDDAAMIENGKLIYSVMSKQGMTQQAIAGMLGNFTMESGVDPYRTEGVYTQAQMQEAIDDLDKYTRENLFGRYDTQGLALNKDAYIADDGKYYCGIGLGQFTGGRAKMLVDYANGLANDYAWYDIDAQLAFMISSDSRAGWLMGDYCASTNTDVDQCTADFMSNWEGNANDTLDTRKQYANEWLARILGWSVNTSYADSIINMAGTIASGAADNTASGIVSKCNLTKTKSDNTSAANAVVAFAYDNSDKGKSDSGDGPHGTGLYRHLVPKVTGQSAYYASCDVCVCTAIRWSGTDDSYPAYLTNQYDYLLTSPHWNSIDWNYDMSQLEAGDVLIELNSDGSTRHTLMYVGHETIASANPDLATANPNYSIVSASNTDRSPNMDNWYHTKDYCDEQGITVVVYRNKTKNGSNAYTDAASDYSE